MLTSISPLGERARHHRWQVTATIYLLGSTLGGLTIGTVLGFLGALIDAPARVGLLAGGLACAIGLAMDLTGRRPTVHRQVDEDWLSRYRGVVYGAGFGFQLGLGLVTIVTSAATYAALALCLVAGTIPGLHLPAGMAIGASFGLVRALPLLSLRQAQTPDRLRAAAAQLASRAAAAQHATSAVLLGAAATLTAAGVLA